MAHVKQFVVETASDLRGGRQSWRVFSLLWSASLVVTFAVAAVRH